MTILGDCPRHGAVVHAVTVGTRLYCGIGDCEAAPSNVVREVRQSDFAVLAPQKLSQRLANVRLGRVVDRWDA